MKEYWAFVMSNEGHAMDLVSENEEDAKERVRRLVTDQPVELRALGRAASYCEI